MHVLLTLKHLHRFVLRKTNVTSFCQKYDYLSQNVLIKVQILLENVKYCLVQLKAIFNHSKPVFCQQT